MTSDADPPGLLALCRRLHPALVGALILHCGDVGVAEEIAQETLAKLWERWPVVATMDAPDSWAYRVAFNLTASRFRRIAAERRARARLDARADRAHEPDGTDRVVVRAAVASLPERQRAALVLRYYADLGVDETAAVMGCAPGTVKSLTSKAIASLRSRLGDAVPREVVGRA